MTGIPLYTSSPINAAKPSGVTPKTQSISSTTAAPKQTTTTTTVLTPPSYQQAQPGAAAFPAPTGTSERYRPVQPTPTTNLGSEGPPPPQPGAMPTPTKAAVLPPPKVGEKYNPPPQPQAMPQPYPPQMAIPPPTLTYGAQPRKSSTSTTNAPSSSYPVALPFADEPRSSLEHPPGYHQDTYASELSSDQRRAHDANSTSAGSDAGLAGFGGLDAGGAWNAAKQWIGTAGGKLSETEQEIWRRMNGKE